MAVAAKKPTSFTDAAGNVREVGTGRILKATTATNNLPTYHQPIVTQKPLSAAPVAAGAAQQAAANPGTQKGTNVGPAVNGGFLHVRQKQADDTWKVVLMNRSTLTPAQITAAMASGLNGPVKPAGAKPGGAAPGAGGGGGAPASGGDTPAPGGEAGGIAKPGPSWIPPRIGLGGLNANPATGKIDWSELLRQAGGVSAADPQYAQELSNNIFAAMQSVAPFEGELQGLLTTDPTTGKTQYQRMFDAQLNKYRQNTSSAFGNAAARGIGSSGMVNATLADQTAEHETAQTDNENHYGNTRIADLLRSMTNTLSQQDTNMGTSYYGAVSRAYGGMPPVAG